MPTSNTKCVNSLLSPPANSMCKPCIEENGVPSLDREWDRCRAGRLAHVAGPERRLQSGTQYRLFHFPPTKATEAAAAYDNPTDKQRIDVLVPLMEV